MKSGLSQKEMMKKLLQNAVKDADQVEVFGLESSDISVGYRNGILKEMEDSQNSGICLRVIKDGRIAQISTSNYENPVLLIKKVMNLLPFGEEVNFKFPEVQKFQLPELTTSETTLKDIDRMLSFGIKVIDRLQSFDPSLISSVGCEKNYTNISIMNSNGVDVDYSKTTFSDGAVAIMAEEGNILTSYNTRIGDSESDSPETISEKILEFITIGRKNVAFKGGEYPIILTPSAFADLMATFAAGISGSAVARGMSPLTGKIGTCILDEKISIEDNGLHHHAPGSSPVDDEGVPVTPKFLIRNGVLENYILDLKSAAKLNLEPTGNGFRYTPLICARSYAVSPTPSFTNLILPSGDKSYLDFIKDLDEVILIDQLTGVLLGNLINGDWSGNLELAILYKNGKPQGRIKNAMTSGNFYKMFKDQFLSFSSERKWVRGFGGGGNSNLLPFALIDKMNISA